MDWTHKTEEELENLPRCEKFHDYSWDNDNYWGKGLPWARLRRWVEGQKGRNVDSVFHDFVNLKWLLPEYRTKEQFCRHIEIHTFLEDGKVCYHDSFCLYGRKPHYVVEDEAVKTIYVHPTTRLICVHRPPTRKGYRSRYQAERDAKLRVLGDYHQLYKKDGIWYEVKAEVMKDLEIWAKYTAMYRHGRWIGIPKKAPDDILLEETSDRGDNKKPVKIILKRQLNHKELVKYGLKNGK
jgi:hypothetical protein